MTPPDFRGVDRRQWLEGGALVLAITLIGLSRARAASAKLTKAAASYQYTPKGDQRCGLCASFIPGPDPGGPGLCKMVEGDIPPNGWCQLFAGR